MLSRRAICVSRDRGLRRIVEPVITAAGVAVEHRDRLPEIDDHARGAVLVVVDRATRQAAGGELGAIAAPVVVVGDDLDDDGLISAMLDAPVSHAVADPRDRDLGITSEKLATGDVFGLEKYLAAQTAVGQRAITGDADRRFAVAAVCAWAEAIGARVPLVHRLASAADELMMNALGDAPATGASPRALLRWGADERMIAISVSDDRGTLRQRDVIENVRRARRERGRPLASTTESGAPQGAGIGLYLVLGNASSLVVNVAAGRRTEVVCLFDLVDLADRSVPGRRARRGARSLHVFQAAP